MKKFVISRDLLIGLLIMGVVGVILGLSACSATIPPLPPPPPPMPPSPEAATWGESKTNPMPLNYGLTCGNQELVVHTTKRFDKLGWKRPETGNVWLVVQISAECQKSPCDFSVERLQVLGDSNRIYEPCLNVKTNCPLRSEEHYGITHIDGCVIYQIDRSETDLVLAWSCDSGVDRFFELERRPGY